MAYRGPVRTMKLVRFRTLPNAGGNTLYFWAKSGKSGRFFRPEQVPEFEGEEAWFEVQNVGGGQLKVLRRVDAPAGASH
jgi:hypothetical protein